MVPGRKGTETGSDGFGKGAIVRKLTGAGAKSLVKSVSGGEQTSEPVRIFPKLLDRHELQLVVDRRDCRAVDLRGRECTVGRKDYAETDRAKLRSKTFPGGFEGKGS